MNDNNLAKKQDVAPLAAGVIEQVVIKGDLSKLNEDQRVSYYRNLCQSLSLNPLTTPFEYIVLNGKLKLYATRSCTDQLRKINKISIEITKRELTEALYMVTAVAKTQDNRMDESIGVVSIIGLKGNDLANALMKGETKAKRRVALSICGLGFLDENEPETIEDAYKPTSEEIMAGTHKPLVYTVPFGKFKDMKIEEIDVEELKDYIKYILKRAEAGKRELIGDVKEFLDEANAHLEGLAMDAEFQKIVG